MKRAGVILLMIAVAGFLRLYRLDSVPPGLYLDESTDANDALAAWRTGQFRVFYPENNGREGLFINLQAVALGLIGRSRPWVVRLPGALLGTATVVGLYLLARQSGLQRTAWLAAWLMATSFWHMSVSRFGTRVVAAPFALVWAMWLWDEASREGRRWWWLWATAAGLVYGLGFHTYPSYRVTPLFMALVISRYAKRVNLVAIAAALVTLLPLALYAAREPGFFFHRLQTLPALTVGDLAQNTARTLGMFNLVGDLNPRQNIPGRAMLWWPVGLLFLAGLAVAARRQTKWLWWLGIGLLPAIVANEGIPHAWRAVLAAPPAFLLAAIGAEWLAEQCQLRVLTAVLAAAVAWEAYRSYFVVWARDLAVAESYDAPLLDIAAGLNSQPAALPKYVVFDHSFMTVRGLPIRAQTLMFLTDTATPERQRAKNMHYLTIDQTNRIERGYIFLCRIAEGRS